MTFPTRLAGLGVGATAMLAAAMFAAPALSAPAAASHAVARGAAPGVSGRVTTLERHMVIDVANSDIAVDSTGTAYVAWIGSPAGSDVNRMIYLCVLPPNATRCKGGVQTMSALGASSAAGLKVLTRGRTVDLVWFHDTDASETGSHGSEIAEATVQNGTLSAGSDVATGPSFGELLDAGFGPGGALWTVAYAGVGTKQFEVREGITNAPEIVKIPFSTSFATLAFSRGKPIIATSEYGSVTGPVAYTYQPGKSWTAAKTVPGTSGFSAEVGLVATTSGVRLLTNDPDYHPVVAKWTGTGFSRPHGIGDTGPAPSTHDVVTDASGRLVDVAVESSLTVSNLADTTHAAIFRFGARGSLAGAHPQIATTPRGRGWVLWVVANNAAPLGDNLLLAPIRLAGDHATKTAHGAHGSVTVVGPASCLPASSISVAVDAHADRGWKVASKSLALGGKPVGGSLNGAVLSADKSYTLTGTVEFADGRHHEKVKVALKFRSCPSP